MEQNVKLTGTAAVIVTIVVVIAVAVRFLTFTNATDPELEKAVRAALWSTYSGELGVEIDAIREAQDYDDVDELLNKATPDAIMIERISRSEPLMSWSSNQKVIVRVFYRFPGDTKQRTTYMHFDHGSIAGWQYRYETTAISFYTNF